MSLDDVEKRTKRFFRADTVRMRELHKEVLGPLSQVGDVYVIGGVVRDLAFFGADRRPISDVDLVVSGDALALDEIAKGFSATQNRFGGWGVKRGGMRVDFWSFDRTWAKVEKHAKIARPEDLISSTFFDWDAILFNINTSKVYARQKYLDQMYKRVIDINLLPNPSPHGNLVRALRRLVMFDLRPGKRLKWFIDDGLRKHSWNSIVEAEMGAYPNSFLVQFKSRDDFRHRFLLWRHLSDSGVHDRRQMELPFGKI